MITVGLVGLGYWGPNLARVLNQSAKCEFVACCDTNPHKLERICRQYPRLKGFNTYEELLASEVDAIVIATPIGTHYTLASTALARGKHVMVEKPLADSADKALALTMKAEATGRILMTGHTFVYSEPVMCIKQLIDSGAIGELHYLSFSRVNLGLYQKDVDVVWDLAVHDVSIMLYWMNEIPVAASSFGRCCVQENKRDVAFLWMQFRSGVIASCEMSWLSPQKLRRTLLVGSKRMIVYDDIDPNEKVKLYDRGVNLRPPDTFGEFQLSYRMGDMVAPALGNSEPLLVEVDQIF